MWRLKSARRNILMHLRNDRMKWMSISLYIYILKIDRSIIYKKLRKPGYFLSRTRNIDQTIVARLSRTIDLDPARFAKSKQHLYTQKAAAVIYSATRSLSIKRPSIVRASPKVTTATPKQIARRDERSAWKAQQPPRNGIIHTFPNSEGKKKPAAAGQPHAEMHGP